MKEELISKKQLFKLADISANQLYSWKYKKLIPESWFIHKSTFSGKKIFFPKEKILSRINKIKKSNNLENHDLLSASLAGTLFSSYFYF